MEDNKNESFSFAYSAKEQKEIQSIRSRYASPSAPDDKQQMLMRLRKLDRDVTRKASVIALTVGIVGALIMGLGMSLIMTDLAATLGIGEPMIPGIAIGLAGIGIAALSYPLYTFITHRERKRIAPEILRLSDLLLR
ncbi:MAG: hypothetical protein IJW62_04985 [Clostridia bacterium]|nr:hypothetical protein [Clostridia bacterium]